MTFLDSEWIKTMCRLEYVQTAYHVINFLLLLFGAWFIPVDLVEKESELIKID